MPNTENLTELQAKPSFFHELFEITDGLDITIKVERRDGRLTLQVLPKTVDKITPAKVTGTPDELEEGFFEAIRIPLQEAKGLVVEVNELHESLESVKRVAAAKIKVEDQAAKKTEKAKVEKKTPKTPAKKTREKVVKKTEVTAPDMFATPTQ